MEDLLGDRSSIVFNVEARHSPSGLCNATLAIPPDRHDLQHLRDILIERCESILIK
jgi:hypothetical protein